ncbi:unnamed protein product [Urochloa humidicola]
MVAVDESECSRHALEWALRNLAPTLAAPLLVLTVQPLVPLGYVSAASFGAPLGTVPPVAPELIKSMQEQQRELTQALLDKAKAICAEHGVYICKSGRYITPMFYLFYLQSSEQVIARIRFFLDRDRDSHSSCNFIPKLPVGKVDANNIPILSGRRILVMTWEKKHNLQIGINLKGYGMSDGVYLIAWQHSCAADITNPVIHLQESAKQYSLIATSITITIVLLFELQVPAETIVEVGDAKEMICEAAEKRNVDLLVLGSHSRGPIQRLFLGSVSNYCVHHCKCPVLVVKNQG